MNKTIEFTRTHQSQRDRPFSSKTRTRKKHSGLGAALFMAINLLLVQVVQAAVSSCDPGYYLNSGKCIICTAGNYCAGGTSGQVACTAPEWSTAGYSACAKLPSGHGMASASTFPVACTPGQQAPTGSLYPCTTCSSSKQCIDPASPVTCTSTQMYKTSSDYTTICEKCPAGSSCTGGTTATPCVTPNYAAFGDGTCTAVPSGSMSDLKSKPRTCNTGQYTTSTTAVALCTQCPAGSYCSLTAATACVSPNFANVAQSTCSGIYTNWSFVSLSAASETACSWGQYRTGTPYTCVACPVGKYCSTSIMSGKTGTEVATETTCATGYYSPSSYDFCIKIPWGFQTLNSGATMVGCGAGKKATAAGVCAACTVPESCPGSYGQVQQCQQTQYTTSNSAACITCTVTNYCNNGNLVLAANGQITVAGASNYVPCPSGYYCPNRNNASKVACGTATYSLVSNTQLTGCTGAPTASSTVEWVQATSINGGTCQSTTFDAIRSATGFLCQLTVLNTVRDDSGTYSGSLTKGKVSWWGEKANPDSVDCQPAANTGYFGYSCDSLYINNNVHCPAPYVNNAPTNIQSATLNYLMGCNSQYSEMEGQRGHTHECDQGTITSGISTNVRTTYYQNIGSGLGTHACQDCPDSMYCVSSGSDAFYKLSNNGAPPQVGLPQNGYCWGKNPAITHYAPTVAMGVDDRRVSINTHANCIDANAPMYSTGTVFFMSAYFIDHIGALQTCPFQSKTRTFTRNLWTVDTWNVNFLLPNAAAALHKNYPVSSQDSGPYNDQTYTTSAWFFDNEPNTYPWSYCRTDDQYFTPFLLNSHSQVYSAQESTITDCTMYEYLTPNYPLCEPNFGGFISPSTTVTTTPSSTTPTDTLLANAALPLTNQYSQLNQLDDYTGITLKDCPEYTKSKMTGGVNAFVSCTIGERGQCSQSTADYCHDGKDYKCPEGYFKKTTGTLYNTISDCSTCAAGSQCGGSVATPCPAGYLCPAQTSDQTAYSAQPGYTATTSTTSDCNFGFCIGAVGTAATNLIQFCPDGYHNDYATSSVNQFSVAGCSPNDAGTYTLIQNSAVTSAPQTGRTASCLVGTFCPEGTKSTGGISCAPGTIRATPGATSQDDCSDCAAGNFCPAGTSVAPAAANCDAGFYCPARTSFTKDFPCAAGTTTAGGGTSSTSCINGAAGSYFREGATAGDSTLCGPAGYYCPAGATTPDHCPTVGEAAADGATCAACAAGSFCPPGAAATVCQIGYTSAAGQQYCTDSPAGKTATTTGLATATAANIADGKWTLAGDTSTTTNCPAGSFCTGGVIAQCTAGNFCVEGSSAVAPVTLGSVQTEAGLQYDKPCPAGYVCAAATAAALTATGVWSKQGDSGASTTNVCTDGYTCAAGSIGPYQAACSISYWRTGATAACAVQTGIASFFYYGKTQVCPQGMYCTPETVTASTFSLFYSCPIGTFLSANTGNSVASCLKCPGGFACTQQGSGSTTAGSSANPVAYKCAAGYFCQTGATKTTPFEDTSCDPTVITDGTCYQNICPSGYYCGTGTTTPTPCPSGFFSGGLGARTADECIICSEGFYCANAASRILCAAGTVCPWQYLTAPIPIPVAGSSNENTLAAAGYFTLAGFSAQVMCEPGTFSAGTGTTTQACTACTAGSQCPTYGLSAVVTCNAGSDCHVAGTIIPLLCPVGKFLDAALPLTVSQCNPCPVNMFCWKDGIVQTDIDANTATAGKCASGYNCPSASPVSNPNIYYSSGLTFYLCQTGNYCDNTLLPGGVVMNQCGAGTFMPRAGATKVGDCVQCMPGYQCLTAGLSAAVICTAGSACPLGTGLTPGATATPTSCVAGQYCPTSATAIGGTAGAPATFQCPLGTFSASGSAISCTSCTQAYQCDALATVSPLACVAGYYCPTGTAFPLACPEGKTTTTTTATAIANCAVPPSKNSYNKSPTITGTVADGYQSQLAGEVDPIPTIAGRLCQPGSFCVGGDSTLCVAGTFCNNYAIIVNTATNCNAGYVCNAGCNAERPQDLATNFGQICQPGFYCAQGSSVSGSQCPAGTYSNARGLQAMGDCHACSEGYQCASLQMSYANMIATPCTIGKYCIASTQTATLTCAAGQYCPVGSMAALPCPPGTYNTLGSQGSCVNCEAGNYCPFLYTLPAGALSQKATCPVGYSCPNANLISAMPCDPGYFQGATGQLTCTVCTIGFYCPLQATVAPIACPDRFWCPAGSISPTMCADGYLCEQATTITTTSQQVQYLCPPGYYCKSGQKNKCFAGYFCSAGAVTPTPVDGTTGRLANQGYWIGEAGTVEVACLSGFYNSYFGAATIASCIACPAGNSCLGLATAYPTPQTCTAGNVCANGVVTPCNPGTYCTLGTLVMQICPPGTYQDLSMQIDCKECPAGQYCYPAPAATVGAIAGITCPAGYFCPPGSASYSVNPCPIGTYGETAGGYSAITQCVSCPAKFYCPVVATVQADNQKYPCKDGYICAAGTGGNPGSSSASGSDLCPVDNFCVAGVQTTCPDAQYSTIGGITSTAECIICSPGYYCPNHSVGITACPAGSFCPGNHKDTTSITTCPAGSYCPTGSKINLLCQPGTFQAATGQTTCTACTAGSYCPSSGMTAATPCVTAYQHFWCPAGSIYPKKCAIGYKGVAQTSCIACDKGSYCWPDNANANDGVVGVCAWAEGYLCRSGSYAQRPLIEGVQFIQTASRQFTTYNGPSLPGYLATITGDAQACAIGTFYPGFYGNSGTGCYACYNGRYCPNTAMWQIADFSCAAGYYCRRGVTVYKPVAVKDASGATIGDICPVGKFCSYNLIHQQTCPDGFNSAVTGLTLCNSCSETFYCDNTEKITQIKCITGSRCVGGTKRQPLCPIGTYFDKVSNACVMCTATNYCRAGIIADKCAAGYLCTADYTGQNNPAGKECAAGTYCGLGAGVFNYCPYGTMSVMTAARQVSDCTGCQPGYMCPKGSRTALPCPTGQWCPIQGDGAIYNKVVYDCPVGTFNPNQKQVYAADCLNCTAGYYCNTTGISNVTLLSCPMGKYCPQGTIQPLNCPPGYYSDITGLYSIDDCQICPPGAFCTEGSAHPTQCEDGYYCPMNSTIMMTCPGGYYCSKQTRWQKFECPVNSYCPRGSKAPKKCDARYTCGFKTEWQVLCPNGYYVEKNDVYGAANTCLPCEIGTYSIFTTPQCQSCTAGFLCYGTTSSDHPMDALQDQGIICPKGQYCPSGTLAPIDCPPGTYNNDFGAASEADCHLCPQGSYNSLFGQLGCRPCGVFADSAEGAEQCTCTGQYRNYSPVDSSCRCLSGFDYLDTEGVSQGTVSSISDCIPNVLSRCDPAKGSVRDPTGKCVPINDCNDACGGPGMRSKITGVCNCNQTKTVDLICDQNCRNKAPVSTYVNSTFIKLTYANNTVVFQNLTKYVDLFGTVTCPDTTKNCTIKTVEMNSGGFNGSYYPPQVLSKTPTVAATNNQQFSTFPANKNASATSKPKNRILNDGDSRELATISQTDIFNPVYCIHTGDSFMFSIPDSTHFPVYMKDSVINSNPQFDYGSFLNLQTEMLRKQAVGDTTGSIFSFTFIDKGTYVFNDATSTQKLMIVSVMGAGETCTDPDRYVQTVSGDQLAQQGVIIRDDLILRPNYPLIFSMLALLIFGTITIMLAFTYCLRKGWFIEDVSDEGYRQQQLALNIHHGSKEIFEDNNQFINFKSSLIDSEEDDLDNLNFDIQQDLLEAGEKYLHTYEHKKKGIKRGKAKKKAEIETLLKEIEDLINMLSSDALVADMHWIDLENSNNTENIKHQIEKELDAFNKREEVEHDQYASKQADMLKDASDRERAMYEKLKAEMLSKNKENFKELNQDADSKVAEKADVEFAIYDGGDSKSKNNKLVKRIELDENLTQEEKENLLKAHEARLNYIDSLMDGEKKRQEQELDRALKERLEKRRKAQEKIHAKDIKNDCKTAEIEITAAMERQRNQEIDRLHSDHDQQQAAILSSSDLHLQRSQIQALEDLTEQKKRQIEENLKEEMNQKLEDARSEIKRKYISGAQSDEELKSQLVQLLGRDQASMNNLLSQADMERSQQEQLLNQRLADKKAQHEKNFKQLNNQFSERLETEDIYEIEARDKINNNRMAEKIAQLVLQKTKGIDINSHAIQDDSEVKAADVQRKDAMVRAEESKRKITDLKNDVDLSIEKNSLMSQLKSSDALLAEELKTQEEEQRFKFEARRALLKARKRGEKKIEIEEQKIKNQIQLIEEEQADKLGINEEYLRNLFKINGTDQDTPQQKVKKIEILNEFQSDQFLERLAGLLMKQLTEKESLLKLLIHKYMQERLIEIDAIKRSFIIENKNLERIKDKLGDVRYQQTLKKLRLDEENLVRETELKISKVHAEEEADLRRELDKKQMQEQIEFRESMVKQQAVLRISLFGEDSNADFDHDQKALEKYQALKLTEQDRRMRNIELQKKTLTNQLDSELKKQYADYDDLIRRKRDQQREMDNEQSSLLARIQERKDKLKKANIVEGMTKEEQERMLKNYEGQLQQLDSAYIAEQRRQQLMMKQKQELRKARIAKVNKLKEQLEAKPTQPIPNSSTTNKVTQGFSQLWQNKKRTIVVNDVIDENDELYRRLQQWKQNKKAYELRMFIDKLAKASLNLNENEIKIMIIKLIQIEKLLKEMGKVKKAKGAKSPKKRDTKVSTLKGNQTIIEDENEFDQLIPSTIPSLMKKTTSQVVQKDSSQMQRRESQKRDVRASSKLELSPDNSPERETLVKRPDSQSQFGGSKFGRK